MCVQCVYSVYAVCVKFVYNVCKLCVQGVQGGGGAAGGPGTCTSQERHWRQVRCNNINFQKSDCICSLFMLGYNYVSTDIRTEKEAWVYPPVSFIAELGGSLGLFVGFSFLTFWDCFDYVLAKYKKYQIEESQ